MNTLNVREMRILPIAESHLSKLLKTQGTMNELTGRNDNLTLVVGNNHTNKNTDDYFCPNCGYPATDREICPDCGECECMCQC